MPEKSLIFKKKYWSQKFHVIKMLNVAVLVLKRFGLRRYEEQLCKIGRLCWRCLN